MGALILEIVMHTFETPAPARLRVEIPHGHIRVLAEERDTTSVELVAIHGDALARRWIDEAEIGQRGDEVVALVRQHSIHTFGREGAIEAIVHLPSASAARLAIGAGGIETSGRLGDVEATSGSGKIRLAETAGARARTGSGDIAIDTASGGVDVKSGSGDIAIGAVAGDARVTTASGRANIDACTGKARINSASGRVAVGGYGESLEAFSASGDIHVRRADHGAVFARTVSGEVTVDVARNVAAWLNVSTLTGRVRSALDATPPPGEGEERVELTINTVSGNVNVARG